jgi:hypothetical protein
MSAQGAWISIFTEEVWQDPVRDKNRRAFPLTRPAKVMAGLIKEGDLIIDYMKGRNCIVGVVQVTAQNGAQTRRSPVRYDNNYELGGEKYPLYVQVKPLVVHKDGIPVSDILPQLSIFNRLKGPNKWGSFFRSAQHWDYADGEIILKELRRRVPAG